MPRCSIQMLVALLLGTSGCEGGPSGSSLEIRLLADRNVVSEQELVQQLDRLNVMLDSEAGLYPPTRFSQGPITIDDFDRDGQGELSAEYPLLQKNRLPSIRLYQGSLPPGVRFDIEVKGIGADDRVIASGRENDAHFALQAVQVRFTSNPLYLPPQVDQVFPQPESVVSLGNIPDVQIFFTKLMDEGSVESAVSVNKVVDGALEKVFAASIVAVDLGSITRLTYTFAEPLTAGSYTVSVATTATDTAGLPLDQDPSSGSPGDQPFDSTFEVR